MSEGQHLGLDVPSGALVIELQLARTKATGMPQGRCGDRASWRRS
jgi:hypothetical protein